VNVTDCPEHVVILPDVIAIETAGVIVGVITTAVVAAALVQPFC
jgi:hypothetical protein